MPFAERTTTVQPDAFLTSAGAVLLIAALVAASSIPRPDPESSCPPCSVL
jgi:hypothetical protein